MRLLRTFLAGLKRRRADPTGPTPAERYAEVYAKFWAAAARRDTRAMGDLYPFLRKAQHDRLRWEMNR